jgi:hypothetical protein
MKGAIAQTEMWFRAAKYERCDVLDQLIKEGVNVNARGARGMTALMIAAECGDVASVNLLMKRTADPDKRDRCFGKSALGFAAAKGHFPCVKSLLEGDAFVDAQDIHQRTPLMEAAFAGHHVIVRFLGRRDALLDAKDGDGVTSTFLAAAEGHVEVLKVLAQMGAALTEKGMDNKIRNALHQVELAKGFDVANSVVAAVDWATAVFNGPDAMCDALKKSESALDSADKFNVASLHFYLWQLEDADWGILRVRDSEFVQALLHSVNTFLEQSKDRSLSNRGKKALSFALESGILRALERGERASLKRLNSDVLKELEEALNKRQAQLKDVSQLTEGVDTLFTRWDRFDQKTNGKLDQRDAMPDGTWQWLENLPGSCFDRLESTYNAFTRLGIVGNWGQFAAYLRDSELLSDDLLYSKIGAHVIVGYADWVEEHFENFMREQFSDRFHAAPIKKLPRIYTKMTEDAPDLADPGVAAEDGNVRCAYFQLGDAVRGSVRADGGQDMVEIIEKLQKMKNLGSHGKFEAWRIKNTHHADAQDMTGGYRDVKVLGRFEARAKRLGMAISMIVEIQVIDTVYMDIKKFMHKAYAIERGDFDAPERSAVRKGTSGTSSPASRAR